MNNLFFIFDVILLWDVDTLFIDNLIFKVREWLQNLGIGDHTGVVQDDDEPDDETAPLHHDEITRNR